MLCYLCGKKNVHFEDNLIKVAAEIIELWNYPNKNSSAGTLSRS